MLVVRRCLVVFKYDDYIMRLPDIKMHCSRLYSLNDLNAFADVANLNDKNRIIDLSKTANHINLI